MIGLSLLGLSGTAYSESTKTLFNPFTGKLDFITKVSSDTLPPGSTNYIWNTSSLQSGSSYYTDTGYVSGNFYAGHPTVGVLLTGTTIESSYSPTGSGTGDLGLTLKSNGNGALNLYSSNLNAQDLFNAKNGIDLSQGPISAFVDNQLRFVGDYTFFGSSFKSEVATIHSTNTRINAGSGAQYGDMILSASETNGLVPQLRINPSASVDTLYIGRGFPGLLGAIPQTRLAFSTSVGTPTITYDLTQFQLSTATAISGNLIVTSSFTIIQPTVKSTSTFQVKDVVGRPVLWVDTSEPLSTSSAWSVVASTSQGYALSLSTATPTNQYVLQVSTSGATIWKGTDVPADSQALCLLGGHLGHCTSVVGAGGGCTCVVP